MLKRREAINCQHKEYRQSGPNSELVAHLHRRTGAPIKSRGANDVSREVDVTRSYRVHPSLIEYALLRAQENKYSSMGKVLGGDWDLNTTKFQELTMFRALKERFLDGKPWENTEYYHRI